MQRGLLNMAAKKHVFYSEAAYAAGLALLALGCSLMTRAGLGLSMVVSPAYILHLKISQYLPFFSFGMAEYTLQAALLAAMVCVLRRFKPSYLFSFVTAVLYGLLLDCFLFLVPEAAAEGFAARAALYLAGLVLTAAGVAVILRTYISPEVYELLVKEVTLRFGLKLSVFKTCYDCASCLVSVIMSFAFFGFGVFKGIGWGTVVCALVNGSLIGAISGFLDRHFEFKDALPLRRYF